MRHIKIPLFKFDELGTECQQEVVENHRDINVDHEWYEAEIEWFKDEMKIKGYVVEDVSFSGFYSQGDGALWIGAVRLWEWIQHHPGTYMTDVYEYIKICKKDDDDIMFITRKLYPHYCHRFMMQIEYSDLDYDIHNVSDEHMIIFADLVLTAARNEALELYHRLEKIYEGLRSNESVIETIKCNDYEFMLDGTLWKDSTC